MQTVMNGKACQTCHVIRTLDNFTLDTRTRDGLSKRCIKCTNRTQVKNQKWTKKLLNDARRNCEKRNKSRPHQSHHMGLDDSDIALLWENQKGRCYWSRYPMSTSNGRTGLRGSRRPQPHPTKVSLDRLDSTEGYFMGNVVLTCARVNIMRGVTELYVWQEFCEAIPDHTWMLFLSTIQRQYDDEVQMLIKLQEAESATVQVQ